MRENQYIEQPGSTEREERRDRAGFTLVELLVVIGIIATLVGIMMPALSRARERSNCAVCASNMHQVGLCLLNYANENQGWLFPVGPPPPPPEAQIPTTLGTNVPEDQRWPVYVFTPAVYNPPVMLCPSDFEPAMEHSYVVNQHLADHSITNNQAWAMQGISGLGSDQTVVMGEKVTDQPDYYMEIADFNRVVEQYRHGTAYGSNYLWLDWHVDTSAPNAALAGMDPWDPPIVQGSAGTSSGT